jgi:hypothetical protein
MPLLIFILLGVLLFLIVGHVITLVYFWFFCPYDQVFISKCRTCGKYPFITTKSSYYYGEDYHFYMFKCCGYNEKAKTDSFKSAVRLWNKAQREG